MLGRDEPSPSRLYPWIPAAIAEDAPPPDVDAHDIACLDPEAGMWALIILPDATIQPGISCNMIRPFTDATKRVLERHNRHWKSEHMEEHQAEQRRQLYPEAPI